MHENGSSAPRPVGTARSDMETSAVHRSARYPAPMASGALPHGLETHVQGLISYAKGRRRNHRLDPRNGERQAPSSALSALAGTPEIGHSGGLAHQTASP